MAETYLLAFNNEPLDLTNHTHPAVKLYNKAMEQLGDYSKNQNPKLSFPINFEFRSEFMTPADKYDPEMPETYCQKMSLPTSCMTTIKVDNETVSGRWTLYKNMSMDANGKMKFTPRNIDIQPRMSYSDDMNTNPLVFFLMFVSTYTEPLKDDSGKPILNYLNSTPNAKKFLILRNIRKELTDNVEIKKLRAKIDKYIWDEDNGLSNKKIMQIATGYGIPNSENERYINEIKTALDKMVDKNSMKSMVEFMNQISSETDVEVKALMTKAKEHSLLFVKETKINKAWKLIKEDGEEFQIVMLKKDADPDTTLFEALIADYQKVQLVQKSLNKKLRELEG